MHAAVLEAFNGNVKRWDLEPLRKDETQNLWVVSPEVAASPHSLPGTMEHRPMNRLLEKLEKGEVPEFVAYELSVAPIKRVGGKEVFLLGEDALEWVRERQDRFGVELANSRIVREEIVSFKHGHDRISFPLVVVQGVGRVLSSQVVAEAIVDGVGKKRTYGAGMVKVSSFKKVM